MFTHLTEGKLMYWRATVSKGKISKIWNTIAIANS